MFIIKAPHQQAHRLCWCKMQGWNQIPELQFKSTAARGNWPRTCMRYTWQKPPTLTDPREQLVQVFASKIHKFTYISLYLLPLSALTLGSAKTVSSQQLRDNSFCQAHNHWNQTGTTTWVRIYWEEVQMKIIPRVMKRPTSSS